MLHGFHAATVGCSRVQELGAVNPYAVHDHSQPACQGHDRLFHPTAPGDLHRPGFEPGPFLRPQHALSCFVEHDPHTASPGAYTARVRAFHQGLSETGYAEGRNVAIAYRWAEGQSERLPGLAADLVAQRVAVITGANIAAALAAKAVTDTIPIVFSISVDPVDVGLVASLNRPGGNITGATTLSAELGSKRLELMHEVIPTASKVAFLVNPTAPIAESLTRDMQEGARTLGLQLHILHASTERDFDTIFATLSAVTASALVISADPFFNTWSERLAQLASRYAVPAIYSYREFAAAGGLMSYGGSFTEAYRLAGVYTGRILNGERPADLPVQQATKVELTINLKTARALGITFPLSLLGRADEVIE
jgi:putative tryptophan/tyrosine transport system substrate-binding protein